MNNKNPMLWGSIVLAFTAALATSVLAILLLWWPAQKLGLVDHPGGRKEHEGSIPLIGGIAIFIAFLAGLAFTGIAWLSVAGPLAGALMLIVCGVYDDRHDMRGLHKLAWQALAATILVATADHGAIRSLGLSFTGTEMELGPLAVPFTILCVTGFINAVNMMDGIDGLTGGYILIGLVWLLALTGLGGHGGLAGPMLALTGAVVGFLVFNYPYRKHRRKVFLGDAGSMMLGYLLAWFAVTLAQHGEGAIAPGAIAWILVLPVIDTLSLMLRRMVNGRSPFAADRNHLHHLCLRAGFNHRQSTALLVGGALLCGAVGTAGVALGLPDAVMIIGLVPLVVVHQHLISRSASELRIRRVPGVMTQIADAEAPTAAREQ